MAQRASTDGDWRARALRRFVAPLLIAVAGFVVVILGDGTTRAVGWGIVAIAITVAVSLVFLEVGLSEDRDRAEEDRADGAPRP